MNPAKQSHFGPVPRKAAIVLILCLPLIVFYWQVPFISSQVMGNDYIGFPIKQQLELQYSLAHGTVPMYVPGFAGGQTAAALTLGQFYHPISHIAAKLPGYWHGAALEWNTFLKLLQLGLIHLLLFFLLLRLKLPPLISFIISFITVYNLRMLDTFRFGASLENYTGYLLLCLALAYYYLDGVSPPIDKRRTKQKFYRRFKGPAFIIGATYLLVTGGHPQMMYLGLLGAAAAALAIPFLLSKISTDVQVDRKRLVRFYSAAGVCVLIGIVLASAYIVPFYYDFLLTNGQRVGQDFQWSLGYSSSTKGLLNNFFVPHQSEVQGSFGGSTLILLIALIPLLFAARIRVPAAVAGLWAGLLFVFLCAFGESTPFYYYFWKYFPLADSFRVPGRITMLFPFLFLLLLAWVFKKDHGPGPGFQNSSPRKISTFLRTPPGFLIAVSVPLFLLYTLVFSHQLPKLLFCTPSHIKEYPAWVDSLVLWSGFFTFLLVAFYRFFPRKKWRTAAGIALALVIVVQITAQFRVSCWVAKKRPEATLAKMDHWRESRIGFRFDPGFGLETEAVVKQRKNSILEPKLAKFYRQYVEVKDNRAAYRYLRKHPVTDTLVLERPAGAEKGAVKTLLPPPSPPGLSTVDRVELKETAFNRLTFSVEANAPGFFAMSYPYIPGWTARVDGAPVPVSRANGYMLAVPVSKGTHSVEFRFWSVPAFIGMLISCLTFLILALYFSIFALKGKKRIIGLIIGASVPLFLFVSWNTGLYSGDNLGTRYRWTSGEFPNPRNIAYARKAFINSGRDLFYAGLAVDGNIHGPSFRTNRKQQGIFQVDLGSPRRLGEIVIHDKTFNGARHIPLQIRGSIKGREYITLKSHPERGKSHPWRIPMNGEIARYIRLVSSSETILSFSEVEIFPPQGIPGPLPVKDNPLGKLLPSKPVNKEVLDIIAAVNHAAAAGDIKNLNRLTAQSRFFGKELHGFILYRALHHAVETGTPAAVDALAKQGADVHLKDISGLTPMKKAVLKNRPAIISVLRSYGATLSPFDTALEPGEVIERFKAPQVKSPGDTEIQAWNPGRRLEDISPQLSIFGKWGRFSIDTVESQYKNETIFPLRIRVPHADKKGRLRVSFGFEQDSRGFVIDNPGGKYIHFIVSASVPSHLHNRQNYITIRDKKEKWDETSRAYFTSPGWHTYVVSKKIRPGFKRLVLIIRFTPRFPRDEMGVRDVRVFVSAKPI